MLDKTVEKCVDILLKELKEFHMVKHQMPEFRTLSEKLQFAEKMFTRMNKMHEKLRQVIRLGDKLISTIIKISDAFRKNLYFLNEIFRKKGETSALNFSYIPESRLHEVEELVEEAYIVLDELKKPENIIVLKFVVKAMEKQL